MKKKHLLLIIPLLILLTGCGTSPDQLTGPDTTGFWETINKIFCYAIIFFGRIAGNNVIWGLVIMTLVVRIAMIPLYKAQIQSTAKMNKVQPEIKKIQAKYKDKKDKDSQAKMASETQAVYSRHGVNPLAGCLPSLIQLPLLFAFYGAIENLLVYKVDGATALPLFGAGDMSQSFLIFDDMSSPVYILAILAAITTYYSTELSSASAQDGAGSDMMKTMKWMMPVMILFFGFTLPGAMSLYWLIGNIVMIIQTSIYKREDIQRNRMRKKMEKQGK